MTINSDVKTQAIGFRRQGYSYKEIMVLLPTAVSKATLSGWLRDVKLSSDQLRRLNKKRGSNSVAAAHAVSEKHKALRFTLLEKVKAHFETVTCTSDSLLLVGAALYWAEGCKYGRFRFANSDPDMIKFFMRWLREGLGVPEEYITIRVHAYLNNGKTAEEIETFWLRTTKLKITNLSKSVLNKIPKSSKRTMVGKCIYGTVHISLKHSLLFHAILTTLLEKLGKQVVFVDTSPYRTRSAPIPK